MRLLRRQKETRGSAGLCQPISNVSAEASTWTHEWNEHARPAVPTHLQRFSRYDFLVRSHTRVRPVPVPTHLQRFSRCDTLDEAPDYMQEMCQRISNVSADATCCGAKCPRRKHRPCQRISNVSADATVRTLSWNQPRLPVVPTHLQRFSRCDAVEPNSVVKIGGVYGANASPTFQPMRPLPDFLMTGVTDFLCQRISNVSADATQQEAGGGDEHNGANASPTFQPMRLKGGNQANPLDPVPTHLQRFSRCDANVSRWHERHPDCANASPTFQPMRPCRSKPLG